MRAYQPGLFGIPPKGSVQGRDPLDRYYTPQALADALVPVLPIDGATVIEPSCGGGAFVRALLRQGCTVYAQDVDPEAEGLRLADAHRVAPWEITLPDEWLAVDWVVGNPPYMHAEEHIRLALARASRGVAMLLRLAMLESDERVAFWLEHPVSSLWVLAQRPSFTEDGRADSCAYGWFVWDKQARGQRVGVLSWR